LRKKQESPVRVQAMTLSHFIEGRVQEKRSSKPFSQGALEEEILASRRWVQPRSSGSRSPRKTPLEQGQRYAAVSVTQCNLAVEKAVGSGQARSKLGMI